MAKPWTCLHCGRALGARNVPHRCNGNLRKRHHRMERADLRVAGEDGITTYLCPHCFTEHLGTCPECSRRGV